MLPKRSKVRRIGIVAPWSDKPPAIFRVTVETGCLKHGGEQSAFSREAFDAKPRLTLF